MERNRIIQISAGAIILLLAILYFTGAFNKKAANANTNSNTDANGQVITKDPCAEQNQTIQDLLVQIGGLRADTARIGAEKRCLEGKGIKAPTAKKTYTPAPAKKTVITPNPPAARKSVTPPSNNDANLKSGLLPATGTVRNANLDGLRENGIISFCVMANGDRGLHFPQKALDKGVTFKSIEMNPSNDGHNWIVEPIEWMEGDYGLTVDGVFFVRDAMMTPVLETEGIKVTSCMIKAPWTKWQEKQMTRSGDFWIYQAFQ